MVGQAHDDSLARGAHGGVLHRLARLLVDDAKEPRQLDTHRVGGGPAGERLGHAIEHGDPPGGIGDDHAVADALERHAQLLALAANDLRLLLRGAPGRRFLREAPGRLLGLPSLGNVARDLGKPAQSAVLVAQGGDHHAGPETRPVLAQPPAFLRIATGGGGLQRLGGPAGLHLLRRKKTAEVPPDDLLGAIALDALGAGVPRRDPPFRIEQVERVIMRPVHEQAKALLAGGQRLDPPFQLRIGLQQLLLGLPVFGSAEESGQQFPHRRALHRGERHRAVRVAHRADDRCEAADGWHHRGRHRRFGRACVAASPRTPKRMTLPVMSSDLAMRK